MDIALYAVIGNPIQHSQSPLIHQAFAEQLNLRIQYERVLAPLDGFVNTVQSLMAQGYKGANVTVPFKFEAYDLCGHLGERAEAAQAVNTLSFRHQEILGDNTDGLGLLNDIQLNHGVQLRDKRVLLMGAGGAAYGVVQPLLQAGVALFIANRTIAKAEALALRFNDLRYGDHHPIVAGDYALFSQMAFDVVVNATSSGLNNEALPISAANFLPNALAYDMMYGKETQFKQLANRCADHGVKFADGIGMLVEQAAAAFAIWHGVVPNTQPVIAMMKRING